MSLFGTLRKKGKKVHITLTKEPQFSSTPNLNAVVWPSTSSNPSKSRSKFHVSPNASDISDEQMLVPTKHGDEKKPTMATLAVPATATATGAAAESSGGSSSMNNFMSLVSMASSLKRLKKPDKKKASASTSNLHRIEAVDTREAVIHEDSSASPVTDNNQLSANMKTINKSAPVLDVPKSASDGASNTEPGVISSSSSTSSCNQSDTSSISSYNTSSLPRPARGLSVSSSSLRFNRKSKRSKSGSRNGSTNDEIAFETSVNTKYVQDINRTQLVLQCAKKFNMDPKRGIDFLVLNGIIERTPEDVARFLKDGEGLSKTAIGNYLGEYVPFNLDVLQAFVDLHDFTDVILVQALRQFLWSFRLPGESQKIDRMMESFAKRYCQLNPNLFKDSDTCYLLSFAIIMLNTALHNPNVKTKTTLDQFIRMTDSEEKDRPFITTLYNSILEEPFKIPEEDGNDFVLTFFNPAIEGWLWKQGGHYKTWKRRWFILSNNCLYYFHFTTDRVPRGIIPLENIVAKPCPAIVTYGSKHQYCFILQKEQTSDLPYLRLTDYIKSCKTLSDGQTVPGKHLTYNLATNTEAERTRWVDAISQNSSSHDFYTLLAQKKNRIQALQQKGQFGAKQGTMTIGRTKKSRTANTKSVRKSQISLPLTTAFSANSLANSPTNPRDPLTGLSTAEEDCYNFLIHPKKNPHNYFLTLPSAKSKGLSLSHDSVSVPQSHSDNNSGSGYSATDDPQDSNSSDDDEGHEIGDDDILISTFASKPSEAVAPDDATKRVSNASDADSTSASDFLIKKYCLPIRESSSAILKRYDSIINPPDRITLTPPRSENSVTELDTVTLSSLSPPEEHETPEIVPQDVNRVEPSPENLYGVISHRNDNPSPIEITTIPSEEIVPNKRSLYKKETSLDRHVEEILQKQKRCIPDLENSKDDVTELEKANCADRTIGRVTSFSKTIITTTLVKSVRKPSINQEKSSDDANPNISTGHCDTVRSPDSDHILINYGDQDQDFGKSIIHRTSEPCTRDNKLVVEYFNSVVIENVRHTEV